MRYYYSNRIRNMKINEIINEAEKLILEGKFTEAERLLISVDENKTQNPAYFNQVGVVNFYMNRHRKAIEYFDKALMLDAENIDAGLNLSDLYFNFGKKEKALDILLLLNAAVPNNQEIIGKINSFANEEKFADKMELFHQFENYFPTTFIVETTLACNLKCPECAIGDGSVSRKKGFLKFDEFKILADKVRPYVKYFYLHLWGEPMLNKEIIKMIKYASQFTRVNISTNGTMLDEDLARELILSGVSDIIVSIDGMTQEVYEKYRVGGDLKKALNTLENLVKFNNQYSANVNIMPQFIVFKHNQNEMDMFTEFCVPLGLSANFKAPYFRHDDSQFQISDYEEYRRPEYNTIEELKAGMSECANPREVFTVQINGDVILCCHDYDRKTLYGNLFEQSAEEIWNSPKYRLDRWKVISGDAIDFCIENCMTYIPSKKLKAKLNLKELDLRSAEKEEKKPLQKVNLCSGPVMLKGWVNVDISPMADITIDLEKELLPFEDESVDTLVCISAINYFTLKRGFEIIKDVYRVMKQDGIVRFATQDLRVLAQKYLDRDEEFFFQKLENGEDRFPGITFADKFSHWFYGFETGGKSCKYVYDYETISLLFKEAGFEIIEEKKYLESEISEIKLIDNRPEQMFFIEARKKAPKRNKIKGKKNISKTSDNNNNYYVDYVTNLWNEKKEEEAWQKVLRFLDDNPDDKEAVLFASGIIEKKKRYADLIKLCDNYLQHVLDDKEIISLKENALKSLNTINKEKEKNRLSIDELLKIDNYAGENLSDEEHLTASITWLQKAFEVKNKKGVSAAFNLIESEWMVGYPETTGYIIPTFIAYSEFTGNDEFLQDAIKMGEWEISLQWENGGIGEPPGVYGLKPRVFNTAQVMLGWLALYEKTSGKKFLDATIKSANWLVEIQENNGSWKQNTYMGSKTYHSRVAWVLVETFKKTGEIKFLRSAEKFLNWLYSKTFDNGWFSDTSLSHPEKPWTHLYAYTIYGLSELLHSNISENDKKKIVEILNSASENIVKLIENPNKNYLGLPGEFTQDFSPDYNWTCLTGSAQTAIFLRRFGNAIDNKKYIEASDKLVAETKSAQYLKTENQNIFGGIGGSYPINGGYSPFTIPNWAVKFFADSLLLKITENKNYILLG